MPEGRVAKFIYHGSRSRRFLWRFAILLLLIGAIVGYVGSRFQSTGPWNLGARVAARGGAVIEDPDDDRNEPRGVRDAADVDPASAQVVRALADQLTDGAISFVHLVYAIPQIAEHVHPTQYPALRSLLQQRFKPEEAELAFNYLAAFGSGDAPAIARLKAASAQPTAPRFTRYALGRVEMKQQHYLDAYALFRGEGERTDASESRAMAIRALIKAKQYDTIDQLRHDPAYRRHFTPYVLLEIAIGSRNWPEILRRSPMVQLQTFESRVLVMAALVGFAWSFFLLHLGEAPKLLSPLSFLCVAAVGLGVLSTVPTVYAVILQDDILQFSPRGDPLRTVLYFVGGVGLREELCKLLLFVPLLPFLIRRGDEFEALIVASFVGLGFAIEENGGYFLMSELTSAPGRFLTANFSHAALTGLNGLALYRACTAGGRGLNDFVMVFPLTILAHGLYDAGLHLPAIDDTGTISMMVFVACSWFYFSRVRELRNDVRTTVSLTGAYVATVSIVGAAMLGFQMMNLGPAAGARIMLTEIFGSAVLVYMFLREFREPLTE